MKDSILNTTLIVAAFVGIVVIAFQGEEPMQQTTAAASAKSEQNIKVPPKQLQTGPVLAAASR